MKKLLTIIAIAMALTSCKKNEVQESSYEVNATTSKIEWKGSATDHSHIGAFSLKGTVTAKGQTIKSGSFSIPIASIMDYDLPDPAKTQLLNDLKSGNFFNVAMYPESGFNLTAIKPYSGNDTSAVSGANYLLTGDFTMIGQTHQVSFPAKIAFENDSLKTEAKFNLDRTKWGMNIYNDPSKPLYIYPNINISLHVRAAKEK